MTWYWLVLIIIGSILTGGALVFGYIWWCFAYEHLGWFGSGRGSK